MFLTFLAVKNTQTSAIVVLGGYRWRARYRVNYRGIGVPRFQPTIRNEANFVEIYGPVQHHMVPGSGAVRIGTDVIASEDNLQRLGQTGVWEAADDSD
jgi:hypothetical protein